MKHLKLIESGFANMTGMLGDIEFEDGVSVSPLSDHQASRICAAMRAEFVDGTNSSASGLLVTNSEKGAVVVDKMKPAQTLAQIKAQTKVDLYIEKKSKQDANEDKYSRADLEFIADEDGIQKLREIASRFGVKANSIAKLIDGILQAQG